MKIHEYQATNLFKEAGIPVVLGEVVSTLDEAKKISKEIGYPLVLKAQVLIGGRGKAGGIKIVHKDEELEDTFNTLKNLRIKECPVDKVLIVQAVKYTQQFYVGLTIDNARDDVVLMASSAGGVDIEETAKTDPEAIKKLYLYGENKIDQEKWESFAEKVFADRKLCDQAKDIFQKLIDLYFEKDCSLAEINPLVIDDEGQLLALDAKINFDENALFRQESIASLRDLSFEEADELEAKEHGLSFVKLEGSVGCIVNGAGLAMATLDIIKLLGGQPSNFLDVGGSSNPQKVLHALNIILRDKEVKAVLINIFGGITRCDDIAKGIVQAIKELDLKIPLVVRLTGTNEKEAKEILASNKIKTFPTMREAVIQVIALTKGNG